MTGALSHVVSAVTGGSWNRSQESAPLLTDSAEHSSAPHGDLRRKPHPTSSARHHVTGKQGSDGGHVQHDYGHAGDDVMTRSGSDVPMNAAALADKLELLTQ